MDREKAAKLLGRGIEDLGLQIDGSKQKLLLDYLDLLIKWNQAYNLSGIKDPLRMVSIHLLDSLSILPYIKGDFILDVGTGAGLPGIPLAICLPQKKFLLLDSNGKKTRFLFHVKTVLGLDNVQVFNDRVESFQCQEQIDLVITRAFSSLKQCLEWSAHLLGKKGKLLAMKGEFPEHELADLPKDFVLRETHALKIPGDESQRHLLELTWAADKGSA